LANQLSLFLVVFLGILGISCVSVSIKQPKYSKAKEVQFSPPEKPFTKTSALHVDHAWSHPTTGSIISFVSECSEQSDPSLEVVSQNLFQSLKERKILFSKYHSFNERMAIHQAAQGKVDGVDTRLEVVVFKKDHCLYILNFVSSPEAYSKDNNQFKTFVSGFRVP
jgi:hypothetical protein